MKTGTSIIFRPNNQGEQQHGEVIDTVQEFGSTLYLVDIGAKGLTLVRPREVDVVEKEHGSN